ncbi:MAG: EAL domain-containing protein [Actinobacteria bacterium]|nr:MAG: EAL domain-containing protein [Actinomycetota bacterium]
MLRRRQAFRPFATRGRRTIAGILATFALFSTLTVTVSIWATSGSRHRASVLEVAARQRTLAERYVKDVLLARAGAQADPALTGRLLALSADALLNGGVAPAVNGDDDETLLPPASGVTVRAQLRQERRLVRDLTATGSAVLARRPATAVKLTADERLTARDPVERLRVLSALTSNVSLNAARTIGAEDDRNIGRLIVIEVVLGAIGLLTSLLLAFGLIAATRRQTAHFRSLVTSSTDLVLVFGDGGCRYASESVATMLGHPEDDLLGEGFAGFVHEDDRASVCAAYAHGEPHEIVFRVANEFHEWRHLEAHVTDLRADRQIRGIVLNARDVTERLRLEEELTHQAFHDGLTGLPNRALFRDRLDQSLARSKRSHEGLAVLLLDLDGFKQVNDSLGHDAGDQLLEEVARRFGEVTRPADTLARFGGDEFALLLEGANETQAVAAANRLVRNLSEPIRIAGHELGLGASVGIAMHAGGEAASEELIRHADLAMYAAKEAGRGRHEVFRYDMARELGELLGLEHELRLGLQRGEFSLHYQPEIALDTAAIVGVEALLRWHSPTRGSVPPAEFIPIAEATGLIVPLGEYVLHEACAQTARWLRNAALPEGFVTWTNLSGKQLSAGGVSALVREALEAAELPAGFLGLEVTETALVQEGHAGERARAELQELHELGVRIAVDDFGTGFSSLGQLRSFPVDMIKVDRSFVQGIEHDAKDAAITANLVSLAHALGLLAIAEGIESDGQLTSLRELGCDLAQGFLFARPAPPEEIDRLLAEGSARVSGGREAAA